jgi:electron transfer flavoprotein alpha subunit
MSDFSSNGILRRDPRVEWIIRNRLHPLHSEYANQGEAEVRGPSGLIRKNPHKVGFIGPNGIKRIDRLKGNSGAVAGKRGHAAQEVQLPLYVVENPERFVVVVPDLVGGRLTSHDKDVLGFAHQLLAGDKSAAVVAVCFGEVKEEHFDLAGVDRLIHIQGEAYEGYAPEARAAALMQIGQQLNIANWLFPDSIHGGTDLGSRLAAKLGERPATQVWQFNGDKVVSRGASGSLDIIRGVAKVMLLLEECADAIDETRHEVKEIAIEGLTAPQAKIVDGGLMSVDPNAIPLAEAEFILSAGNGIHNWDQFHDAAKLLGATEGASRVAVDDGFMPRFRQVGATGTWVTARVYVAVGISGAIQHMQGIGQVDKVVAINTDAGCDMVKRAALSVIGDSEQILAALMKLVAEHRGATLSAEEVTEHAA